MRDPIMAWHAGTSSLSTRPTAGMIGEYEREAIAREVAEVRRSDRARRRHTWRRLLILPRPMSPRVEPTD